MTRPARTATQILAEIDVFRPRGGVWLPLDQLLSELWAAGLAAEHLPVLFRVFERFPEDDGAGVLWSIVHGVEHSGLDYELDLHSSMARRPSLMADIMLQRLERSRAAGAS